MRISVKKLLASLLLLVLLLSLLRSVLAWEIERPLGYVTISKRTENCTTDGMTSVGLGMSINAYFENCPDWGGDDVLSLNVTMNSNTRAGITYDVDYNAPYRWCETAFNTGIVGDDAGAWINMTDPATSVKVPVCFYGGPKSAIYEMLWVCTNGFISFEHNSTSPSSQYMPDSEEPNGVVAALWRDLLVDSESSITYGFYNGFDYFVISWNNVLDKGNNKRQTFQIFLQSATSSEKFAYEQSRIYISYQSVDASTFAYGIEDSEGLKGLGGISSGCLTHRTFKYYQNSNYALLKCLTINFDENDNFAGIWISADDREIKGIHLRHKIPDPPEDLAMTLLLALSGPLILLAAKSGIIVLVMIADIARYVLIPFKSVDLIMKLARLFRSHVEVLDAGDSYEGFGNPALPQGGYITVLTEENVVDASLGIHVLWRFNDLNSCDHSLRISATAQYDEYKKEGIFIGSKNVTTIVDLNVLRDAGNTKATARQVTPGEYLAYVHSTVDVDDFYNVTVPANKWICLTMTMDSTLYADLYLYNPGGQEVGKSEKAGSAAEYISYHAVSSGDYTIKVKASSGEGLYRLEIAIFDFELKVETRLTGGGEITDVKVWVNYELKYSPLAMYTSEADHIVEVESTFIRIIEFDIYEYTFVRWEDHSTTNPRTITIEEDRTLIAYYRVKYVGSILRGGC